MITNFILHTCSTTVHTAHSMCWSNVLVVYCLCNFLVSLIKLTCAVGPTINKSSPRRTKDNESAFLEFHWPLKRTDNFVQFHDLDTGKSNAEGIIILNQF